MFEIEKKIIKKDIRFLIGVDEAGRGPLAGPVVSSAVAVKAKDFLKITQKFKSKIKDSKKLTFSNRIDAYSEIRNNLKVGLGICGPAIIDKINILQAAKLSMQRAISSLHRSLPAISKSNAFILVDGKMNLNIAFSYVDIVRGDSKCFSISCASIVAKVVRDEIMAAYDFVYPGYNFSKHKGYGTKKHISIIKEHGITAIHRKSFSPCST